MIICFAGALFAHSRGLLVENLVENLVEKNRNALVEQAQSIFHILQSYVQVLPDLPFPPSHPRIKVNHR